MKAPTEGPLELARKVLEESREPVARAARRRYRARLLGETCACAKYLDSDVLLAALELAGRQQANDGEDSDTLEWLYRADVLEADAEIQGRHQKCRPEETDVGRIRHLLESCGALVTPPGAGQEPDGKEMARLLQWEAGPGPEFETVRAWDARQGARMHHLGEATVETQPCWYRTALYDLLDTWADLDLFDPLWMEDDAQEDEFARLLREVQETYGRWDGFLPPTEKWHNSNPTPRDATLRWLTIQDPNIVEHEPSDIYVPDVVRKEWLDWLILVLSETEGGPSNAKRVADALVAARYAVGGWRERWVDTEDRRDEAT